MDQDLTPFKEADEWHYIQWDLESNIYLLRELYERGLLPPEVRICDCGIGLGTPLCDFFLQSEEIPPQWSFFGIEKWQPHIEALRGSILPFWGGRLETLAADLQEADLTPFYRKMSGFLYILGLVVSSTLIIEHLYPSNNFGEVWRKICGFFHNPPHQAEV